MKMKMLSAILVTIAVLGTVLSSGGAQAGGVLLDDFLTTGNATTSVISGTSSATTTNPIASPADIIGGFRTMTVTANAIAEPAVATSWSVSTALDRLTGSSPDGVVPKYEVTYAGANPPGTGFTPTNFINPILPLSDHFVFMQLRSNDQPNAPYRWIFTDQNGNSSSFNGTLPAKLSSGSPLPIQAPFDQFVGTADFTKITKVEFAVNPNLDPTFESLDISFTNSFVVVPEPSTIVFAGLGIAMSGWHTLKSRRRKVAASRQG